MVTVCGKRVKEMDNTTSIEKNLLKFCTSTRCENLFIRSRGRERRRRMWWWRGWRWRREGSWRCVAFFHLRKL